MDVTYVKCNECHKIIKYKIKRQWLNQETERIYTECPNCTYQVTIMYLNTQIRYLLNRQKHMNNRQKEKELQEHIEQELLKLKNKYEN